MAIHHKLVVWCKSREVTANTSSWRLIARAQSHAVELMSFVTDQPHHSGLCPSDELHRSNALDRRLKPGDDTQINLHSRRVRTVPGDAPTAIAISRKLAPCSRNHVISSPLTIRRGLPSVFPLSLALRSPARTRS